MSSNSLGLPPPTSGDVSRAPSVLAVIWVETGIAIPVLIARFYARTIINRVGIDDWLMLATLIFFIACACVTTVEIHYGGYRHTYYLDEYQIAKAGELNFILRAGIIVVYLAGKASVGALILRIISPSSYWRKILVWVTVTVTGVINVLNCIFNFVQCNPVEANWTPGLTGDCWNPKVQADFAYFMSSENILADVILALLPATFLYDMNMSIKKRITLSLILGAGLLAAVCGVVKTTTLKSIDSDPDFIYSIYALTVWGVSEAFVIIICGSIAPLTPFWDRRLRKRHHRIGFPYDGAYDGGRSATFEADASAGLPGYSLNDQDTSQPPSTSSQTNRLRPEDFSDNEIRATTKIEITSSAISARINNNET